MNTTERQMYKFIDKFKHHIQDYLQFKPIAMSNFHHFSDRLLDYKDGSFEKFRKNVKEMIKDSIPINQHGQNILWKLDVFVKKGRDYLDFVNIVYWIYEE